METEMKAEDSVGVTFVNTVVARGILNGVVNLSFGVFNFTPDADGNVDLDPAVACRLRMDKVCAVQLRDTLNTLIAAVEEAERGMVQPVEAPAEKKVARKEIN